MKPNQLIFVRDQVFAMSMMATAQRGRLYCENVTDDQREALREDLRKWLGQRAALYVEDVADVDHMAAIELLANHISSCHPGTLFARRFRIGSAQKILNLYLKYLWCLGEIKAPPHCPFDSIVLAEIPGCREVRWTQFDSIEEYERIVREARSEAGDLGLAEWELRMYNAAAAKRAIAARSQSAGDAAKRSGNVEDALAVFAKGTVK